MSNIKVNDLVKYLPGQNGSWVGVVDEIRISDSYTRRHGHSGDVYIIKDPFSTVSIATSINNIVKCKYSVIKKEN